MGALILAPIQPISAGAAIATAGNMTLSVRSGSLIIFASNDETQTNTGIPYSTSLSNGTKTFYINNSGNFGVSRFEMTLSLPSNSNVSSFKRCGVGILFNGNNSCAQGTSSTVTLNPGSPTTYLLPLPKNSFYSFQITQNKSGTLVVSASASTTFVTSSVSSS